MDINNDLPSGHVTLATLATMGPDDRLYFDDPYVPAGCDAPGGCVLHRWGDGFALNFYGPRPFRAVSHPHYGIGDCEYDKFGQRLPAVADDT